MPLHDKIRSRTLSTLALMLLAVLPAGAQDLDAAVNWTHNLDDSEYSYLFHDRQYVRYSLTGSAPDGGIRDTQGGWKLPPDWDGEVDAAVNWGDGCAYLFKGSNYVRYLLDGSAPDGPVRSTQAGWNLPPHWKGRVDAAVNWGNGNAYLFHGDEYVRYPLNGKTYDDGPRKTSSAWNLPKSWNGHVHAAVNWGNDVAYLFHGSEYVRYPLEDTSPEGSEKNAQQNWKLPKEWLQNSAVLFRHGRVCGGEGLPLSSEGRSAVVEAVREHHEWFDCDVNAEFVAIEGSRFEATVNAIVDGLESPDCTFDYDVQTIAVADPSNPTADEMEKIYTRISDAVKSPEDDSSTTIFVLSGRIITRLGSRLEGRLPWPLVTAIPEEYDSGWLYQHFVGLESRNAGGLTLIKHSFVSTSPTSCRPPSALGASR